MPWNLHTTHAVDGDLIELVGLRQKYFIFELHAGTEFHTHRGVVKHDDIIGQPWGSVIHSHNGSPFFLLQPALSDLLRETIRNTQIIYPKDIGYILTRLGVGPGQTIIEAGTGSGAFTTALAFSVGKTGKIYTYEARKEMQDLAKKNLRKVGMDEQVIFTLKDIREGFNETNVDALFLDLPNPFDYIPQVRSALKPGGFFGCILPTVNQVTHIIAELGRQSFAFVDVVELLLRYYKADYERFRPSDRMVAHTGYLIFARPLLADIESVFQQEPNAIEALPEPGPDNGD